MIKKFIFLTGVALSISANAQEVGRGLRPALNLGLAVSPKIILPGTLVSAAGSDAGELQFDTNSAFTLSGELSEFEQNSWNNGVKIGYQKFTFDKYTLSGRSGSATYAANGSMTLISIGYVGKYLWESFYIPVEIALVSATTDSNGTFTKKLKSNLLTAFGIGTKFSDNLAGEVTFNSFSIPGESESSGGVTLTSSTGSLRYFQLTAKYIF